MCLKKKAKEGEGKILMEKEKLEKQKQPKTSRRFDERTKKENNSVLNSGITLIALVITIVLNCSCLAMERIREIELKKKEISCII